MAGLGIPKPTAPTQEAKKPQPTPPVVESAETLKLKLQDLKDGGGTPEQIKAAEKALDQATKKEEKAKKVAEQPVINK